MYQRILVPLDGSQQAEQVLAWVEILANGMDAQVDLLRVTEPIPAEVGNILRNTNLDDLVTGLRTQAEEYLEDIADSLRNNGLAVSASVIEGDPAWCIASQTEQETGTLLAMTTHGRSGLGRWFMGNVTDKVLQAISCPMLVVRAYDEENPPDAVRFETIIAPLDGSPVAEQALPHVEALARALSLRVLLVMATSSGGARIDTESNLEDAPSAGFVVGDVEYSSEEDAEAMEYLRRVREDFNIHHVPSVEERLLKEPAAAAIVDLVQETPYSLTVMATHGRSGLGRWVMGSVTDRVVRQSRSLVLVVRATEPEEESS